MKDTHRNTQNAALNVALFYNILYCFSLIGLMKCRDKTLNMHHISHNTKRKYIIGAPKILNRFLCFLIVKVFNMVVAILDLYHIIIVLPVIFDSLFCFFWLSILDCFSMYSLFQILRLLQLTSFLVRRGESDKPSFLFAIAFKSKKEWITIEKRIQKRSHKLIQNMMKISNKKI